MTFSEYCGFYEASVLPLLKHSSQKSVRSRLKRLSACLGSFELPLSPMDVQREITKLAQQYPAQTIQNLYGTLRMVLNSAKADGLVESIPKPSLPKVHKEEQDWFKPEEMKALSKYSAMNALFAETGARMGEVLALRKDDFDTRARILTIQRNVCDGVVDVPKSRAGRRSITISGWLLDYLQDQRVFSNAETNLFPRSAGYYLNELHRACRVLDINSTGFHAFRRGNGTLLGSVLGAPTAIISYRLGHASLGVTLDRYVKYMVGLDKEWADKLAGILK